MFCSSRAASCVPSLEAASVGQQQQNARPGAVGSASRVCTAACQWNCPLLVLLFSQLTPGKLRQPDVCAAAPAS